ncbi:helix-turn-helix domain-containing protein [Nocardia sp. AB354]|uniref:helix-turn-helix domain-containing protein n=1 Tax=Nocardia sp. AB354 TaxID=3413283 RepID=UPI003C27BE43
MGQAPKKLDPTTSPAAMFGSRLRDARNDRGLSLAALGRAVHVSGDLIGKIEKAERSPALDLVARLDVILCAHGDLVRLAELLRAPETMAKASLTAVRWAREVSRASQEIVIETPAGRYFDGAMTPAVVLPAQLVDGQVVATEIIGTRPQSVGRLARRLIVTAVHGPDRPRFFGVDTTRRRLPPFAQADPVRVPIAYELDDLTLGLLWAITNLDDALLEDDSVLADTVGTRSGTVAVRDAGSELSAVSQMWLGSSFCASHILRNAGVLSSTPQYWTAERSGEETSGWLLFAHKFAYLQRTSVLVTGAAAPSRTFCLPTPITDSMPDRVLLLLTVALMESFGIRVEVTTDAEFAVVPGFVLDRDDHAIVANWVRGDELWHVDIMREGGAVGEFSSVIRDSSHHSILRALDPRQRLRTLSEFLSIDWLWLVSRCGALAQVGLTPFIRPRSRLLSLAGADRACQFIAYCGK